ncbi:MAG TPA: DEAD/DEAH box helicase [Actinoplanes sp.]|nr:DEAD/DEAH box helicase [Actinoplanes sp.]
MVLTEQETAICHAVGTRDFLRARGVVQNNELADAHWDRATGVVAARLRDGSGVVRAVVTTGSDGTVKSIAGRCTCEWAPDCGHLVGAVLAAGVDVGTPPVATAWEAALSSLVAGVPARRAAEPEVGLQFEVDTADQRIGLRPVVPGRTGWIRTGISWRSLGHTSYTRSAVTQRHLTLLKELRTQVHGGGDTYHHYYFDDRVLYLDDFPTRRVWDVLLEAQQNGLPLVAAGKSAEPVTVTAEPVTFSVRADRDAGDLRLRPVLSAGTDMLDPERLSLIGEPAHGVAWWDLVRDRPRALRVAPLARPISVEAAMALGAPPIVVPVDEEPRFLRQYYPGLTRQAAVVAADDSVTLPDPDRATLTLTGQRLSGHRLELSWEWVSEFGHREPLDGADPVGETRARVLRLVTALAAAEAYGLTEPGPAGRLLPGTVVAGDVMLRVLRDVVPRLMDIDGVAVELNLDEFVESTEAPLVTFTDADGGDRDWFDLAVRVSVGGEDVGFQELFVALAEEREFLILPSGSYFTLDRAEFRQLRELIAESRALLDAPPGVLRVGRMQPGVWQELAEVGEVSGPAAAWQESLRDLCESGPGSVPEVPAGLDATLRGYQQEGFGWLATLFRHRIGGVLADDMGLGKTVQALAMIVHAAADVPFLVVAPASVVGNWASESARFAPGLTSRMITETEARRGVSLAEAAAGADIVVTSYTLFRLEYADYAALPWAGLILDEAQFVKNAASQAYRCARDLPTAFKLAITGTPMENNLAELWALLSITSPGLLSRLDRFTEFYRRPIEREQDQERLSRLRRRLRPLMLRRRKTEVAGELPDKQEQILELELNTKQRRIYQTYLQRERRKVLGLLGDLRKNRFEILRSLTLLRQAALDVALVDETHRGVPSTKLDALAERVTDIVAEGHRILVFSQFTRFLTAARHRLEAAGIECAYLDGKTTRRAEVIDGFKTGTAPVFLISLKSGGFGLNLTEADYCVMLDPWWNPATEAQAVDRVHRIGQNRNVMVYRLVARDTIEEKVMALQARKKELFGSVLDGGEFGSAELTAADIRTLLE